MLQKTSNAYKFVASVLQKTSNAYKFVVSVLQKTSNAYKFVVSVLQKTSNPYKQREGQTSLQEVAGARLSLGTGTQPSSRRLRSVMPLS